MPSSRGLRRIAAAGTAVAALAAAFGLLAAGPGASASTADRLGPAVRAALAADPAAPVSVIVHLSSSGPGRAAIAPDVLPDEAARATRIAALQATFDESSADVRAFLATEERAGRAELVLPLWSVGAVAVRAAPETIHALAHMPEVRAISGGQGFLVEPMTPVAPPAARPAGDTRTLWNVSRVRADDVWDLLGLDGSGVTVAVVDTGVDFHHPALTTRYRGYRGALAPDNEGNWWCPAQICGTGQLAPSDQNGHGTHVAGTILGGQGAGVAPGARWIAAHVCSDTCDTGLVLAAIQWLLAPGGQTALRPDIANFSFRLDVGPQVDPATINAVARSIAELKRHGIVPVAAAGNQGAIEQPASYTSTIAVGAIAADNLVWSLSGHGLSLWRELKPEFVAPGVLVTSTWPGGGWLRLTGTSMASPHVAGTAALLRQAHPGLAPAEIEQILKDTATRLAPAVPSRESGWGLINAFDAVASVIDVGFIEGRVLRTGDDRPVPHAEVQVNSLPLRDPLKTVAVDPVDASFRLALPPGEYQVLARAFGYADGGQARVRTAANETTHLDLHMAPGPVGVLWGRVSDGHTGVPVEAAIVVEDTPVTLNTDPDTGTFSRELPPGLYNLRVESLGYRVLTDTVKIFEGQPTEFTRQLVPAPRVLLVDGDAWRGSDAARYFRASLRRLGYAFDEHQVLDERAPGLPHYLELARSYDLLIWTSDLSSPGFVRAGQTLHDYLQEGGRLILSGQDIVCTDTGATPCARVGRRQPYAHDQLHLRLVADNAASDTVVGLPGGPLEGITVTLNGGDSNDNQFAPDVLEVADPRSGTLIAEYAGGGGAAAFVGTCLDYRAVVLGFGLEGIAGAEMRDAVLRRIIGTLAGAGPDHRFAVVPERDERVGPAGSTATYTVTLRSTGTAETLYDVSVEDAEWDTTLWSAGFLEPLDGPVRLYECQEQRIGVRVAVPEDTPRGGADTAVIRIGAREAPVEARVELHTRTPAPVLVVDADHFSHSEQLYLESLDQAGAAYDVWEFGLHNPHPAEPSAAELSLYPVVVWFTGDDFRPTGNVSVESQQALAGFLEAGGRLLLSSEDFLTFRGSTPYRDDRLFHVDFLGVADYREEAGRAHGHALVGGTGSAFDGLGACRLAERPPGDDFSDLIMPRGAPVARAALMTEPGRVVATQIASGTFKSLFMAFDAGELDPACGHEVMSRALDWFSPLHRSTLGADRHTYGAGERVRLSLSLLNDGPRDARRVAARWQLPEGGEPVTATLPSDWTWRPEDRSLIWSGDLDRFRPRTWEVDLALDPELPEGGAMTSTVEAFDGEGLSVRRSVDWGVNVPDLTTSEKLAVPNGDGTGLSYGDRVRFTVIVRNVGVRDVAAFTVTDTLPSGLSLVEGSITRGTGTVDPLPNGLVWHSAVATGSETTLSFEAHVATRRGGRRTNVAVLDYGAGDRLDLTADVHVRGQLFLPSVLRGHRLLP